MKTLNIFISYSRDDGPIATSLSNLLQAALGPASAEVFLDSSAIGFGSDIRAAVIAAAERADILIAVMTGAQPASSLSWPAFEIGTFLTAGRHRNRGEHKLIDKAVLLINRKIEMGPLTGQRPVDLGITSKRLSADKKKLAEAREAAAIENREVLELLREMEELVRDEEGYQEFARTRSRTLQDLVCDFKRDAFDALRRRPNHISKPTPQLLVRTTEVGSSLPDSAKVTSIAGASEVFGQPEDSRLFTKTDEDVPGSKRYETTWGKFKASVTDNADNPYGAYWCAIIEQSVIRATKDGFADPDLVVTSTAGDRYRIIATTITTYFNNDSEVSLYLIKSRQRRQRGDPETSKLLNVITLVSHFRFAFLEGNSEFYWQNFLNFPSSPQELLMELDYLRSEATHADLEKPGTWRPFLTQEELDEMLLVWNQVEKDLRIACSKAIAQQLTLTSNCNLTQEIADQLKKISEDIRRFNSLVGSAASEKLAIAFESNEPKGGK